MPEPLSFDCAGERLAGTLHTADGATGVVIVVGGVQTRAGAHRGFFDLAERLAAAGHPVLRYDRRGLGDSDGADPGFRASAPDIAAAVATLRKASGVRAVVGWGLCDGAAALAMQRELHSALDGLILANPWTLDADEAEAPTGAAVAAHYRARLVDRAFWRKLLRGGVSLSKFARGLGRLRQREPATATARAIAAGIAGFGKPVLLLLSGRDNTAATFEAAWRSPAFAAARRAKVTLAPLAGADHSFSRAEHAAEAARITIEWLKAPGSSGRI